jgi:DNA-binding MarR family transcriptional regulator
MGISSARVNVPAPATEQAELSEAELGAWRGLVRVHAALVRELDAELDARHGLPLSSYEVLRSLSRAPGGRLRMAELAEYVLLSRSGMTRLIDRLEREGMVCRSTCDKDGRGCYAGLTDRGRATVAEARSTHIAVVRAGFLSHFSEPEMRELATMFERVLKT